MQSERTRGHIEGHGFKFTLRLREPKVRRSHEPTPSEREHMRKYPDSHSVKPWDYVPSGTLQLEFSRHDYHSEFLVIRDAKSRLLETKLTGVPLQLLRKADDELKAEAERAEWTRKYREGEERKRLEEQRRKEEQERMQALHDEADRWQKAQRIREYLDAVRRAAIDRGVSIEPSSRLAESLGWAESVAERLDPIPNIFAGISASSSDGVTERDESFRRLPR